MNKRNDVYDSLKLIFAIVIFLNHCSFLQQTPMCDLYENVMHNGRFGVCFFFMCSGYCVYRSNIQKGKCILAPRKFAIAHVRKLYPLYMITNIVMALWFILRGGGIFSVIAQLCLAASLLQTITVKYGYILNAVGWYFSVSFIMYYLSPFLIKTINKIDENIYIYIFCLLAITPCYDHFIITIIREYAFDERLIMGLNDVFPLYWLACYSLGMFLNKIELAYSNKMDTWLEAMVLVVSLFVYLYCLNNNTVYYYRTGAYILSNMVIILVFSKQAGFFSVLLKGFSAFARKVSSNLFLIHYVVIVVGDTVFNEIWPIMTNSLWEGLFKLVVFLFISVMLSMVWHRHSQHWQMVNSK